MRIHKGDTVQVIAGKDRTKTGKVLRAYPREGRVIVEGLNMQKRHVKARKDTKQGAGIIEVAAPIHVSNVQLVDPKTSTRTRVGVTFDAAKKRNVRVAKKSGTTLK
jgi:large subunit ribosomal protein L24